MKKAWHHKTIEGKGRPHKVQSERGEGSNAQKHNIGKDNHGRSSSTTITASHPHATTLKTRRPLLLNNPDCTGQEKRRTPERTVARGEWVLMRFGGKQGNEDDRDN